MLTLSCVNAEDGDFSDITQEISRSKDNINLTRDYIQSSNENNIFISKSVFIDGNSHNIKSIDKKPIVKVVNNINVTFKNITFHNYNNDAVVEIDKKFEKTNVTFVNCSFNLRNGEIYAKDPNLNDIKSPPVTNKIKKLAISIVGKSSGIPAAKKLADWVYKNIKSEHKAGFYQSPSNTLLRKKGNCCCRSELFLQMCNAIGLSKNHKLYFVHVGRIKFGYRHFFVVVDHTCVDVTLRNSWGRGGFFDRPVFSMTKYPMLPIQKSYK